MKVTKECGLAKYQISDSITDISDKKFPSLNFGYQQKSKSDLRYELVLVFLS